MPLTLNVVKLAPMWEDTRYVFFGRHHTEANVFLRLEQRLCDTGILIFTALLNTGRLWAVQTQPTNML